ncbi:MAG: hypothetical protein EXX96DRAFT_556786 [Benjaminiella poitrasii]|nr:MAG: hypothetical protein EXX96DRAFT_556786 [Benjaminiella poitrasii]
MPLFSKKIVPTEITSNIEKAVNPSTSELDWSLVFQICDSVNSTELGAKEARKLLQKKMMSNDPKTQFLALEILNSLAENCTSKFQSQLYAKSFGEDLYTLSSSKTIDDRVRNKLAQCLETWVSQAGGNPQSGAIRRAFDIMISLQGHSLRHAGQAPSTTRTSSMPKERPKPTDVNGDIELAKNSAQLFSQTLSFTDPTREDISKNELIQEFYSKCKQSQQTLAFHLETCEDSELISALINANNELLSCFKSYEEMLEQRAVNEATINSKTIQNNNNSSDEHFQTRQESSSSNPEERINDHYEQFDSTQMTPTHTNNPFQFQAQVQQENTNINTTNTNRSQSVDPFDPFADTNQAHIDTNPETAARSNVLPPPLTPQRMHD